MKRFRLSCQLLILGTLALLSGVGPFGIQQAAAAPLQERTLMLSDNRPGQISRYTLSMRLLTSTTMGSLRMYICSDYALLYYPCTPPTGFDLSNATIIGQTGVSGFFIDSSTTSNELLLTRTPSAVAGGTLVTIELGNVQNQANAGSAFGRYHTYQSGDGTGPATDEGGLAFQLLGGFSVATEVPPYLTMCVAIQTSQNDCSFAEGDFLQLGEFSTNRASIGQSQVTIATNAKDGYTVRVQGGTMASGNNELPPLLSRSPSAPGTSQFGINLRSNSDPGGGADPSGPGSGAPTADYGQQNRFKYRSGDVVARNSTADDYRRYTISYLVNIAQTQPAGVYSSSFSYIGLGNF